MIWSCNKKHFYELLSSKKTNMQILCLFTSSKNEYSAGYLFSCNIVAMLSHEAWFKKLQVFNIFCSLLMKAWVKDHFLSFNRKNLKLRVMVCWYVFWKIRESHMKKGLKLFFSTLTTLHFYRGIWNILKFKMAEKQKTFIRIFCFAKILIVIFSLFFIFFSNKL